MLGIRLDEETERGLESIARQTKRPKSQIAREAIRAYVRRNDTLARAKAEWDAVCLTERDDPEMTEILDFTAREMGAMIDPEDRRNENGG